MISFNSVWAIVLRHLWVWKRDNNLLLSGLYWPTLDILIWGFLGSWIQQTQTQLPNYESAALLGIILWQFIGRGCNVMSFALNEELWSNNIVNMFSLPLRIFEWMIGVILFTAIIMTATALVSILVISMFYNLPMLKFISTLLMFLPPMFISGVAVGFTSLLVVISFGKRSVEIGYIIGWFFLPFSGAYYPIEVLPKWAQSVSSFLPYSYLFQGMRNYVMFQHNPSTALIKGYVLSIIYAMIAIAAFAYCFKRSKHYGLARLTD